MKVRKVVLSLFVLVFLLASVVQAKDNKTIEVSMNGSKVAVTRVPIIMDGKVINTEFPSFVHTNRTLIPVRFVAEHYGAEVGWDQKTQTAIVKHGDKEGRFTLDSNIAMINGEKRILDKFAIPKIASFGNEAPRTMVPLAFMTDIFGFEVGWNDEKNAPYINSNIEEGMIKSIKNISLDKEGQNKKIFIHSDYGLEYDTLYLHDLGIFILDIKESILKLDSLNNKEGIINVDGDKNIDKVEYLQFSKEPSITRLIVHLKNEVKSNVNLGDDGKGLVVSFQEQEVNKEPIEEVKPAKNTISSIKKEIIEGREAIVIYGGNKDNVKLMKLKNPERLVVDIVDSVLEGTTSYSLDYDLDFIKKVRVSQFIVDGNYKPTDKVVRIVLDVKEDIFDPEIKIDGDEDRIIIYPQKSAWENISYMAEGKYRYVTIENLFRMDYDVAYNMDEKILTITIPEEVADLNEGNILVQDGLIDQIQIIKEGNKTRLVIKAMRNIIYNMIPGEFGSLQIALERGDIKSPSDRIIVIDPGHGGSQPGTTSVSGIKERDLNLTISLLVEKKLKALGYNVIMTRTTDKTVGLYERAEVANGVNADMFVSIHGNWNDNKSITGIQVLYSPLSKSKGKTKDPLPFAKIMMEEIVKGTGAPNRGILSTPNIVVVRETKMPSVLVEVGFLSNYGEEQKLLVASYQEKMADSIIKGIEKYLEID